MEGINPSSSAFQRTTNIGGAMSPIVSTLQANFPFIIPAKNTLFKNLTIGPGNATGTVYSTLLSFKSPIQGSEGDGTGQIFNKSFKILTGTIASI